MASSSPTERTQPSLGQEALRLLVSWAVLVGGLLAVGFALTGFLSSSVGAWDDDASRWFRDLRSDSWTQAADLGKLPGETWVAIVVGPLLLVATWFWLRALRPVVFLAVVLVGEVAAYLLVANVVSRQRPPVPKLDPGLDPLHSYPSGHVAAAMALWVGSSVLVWRYGDRLRPLVLLLGGLPLIVLGSRLYQGVHHPTDVVASLVFTGAWIVVAASILRHGDSDHE